MSGGSPMLARNLVSNLRHQLRTGLNHIIGYTEILEAALEDQGMSPAVPPLKAIGVAARQILDIIQSQLPAYTDLSESHLAQLRNAMAGPLHTIIREVAQATPDTDPVHLMDLLRINTAAAELLAFVEGGMPADRSARQKAPALVRTSSAPVGRVLVVDDNEANRDMLTRQLARQGHEVDSAEGGRAALLKAQSGDVDLILLDVVMPEISGLSVLQSLKSNSELSEIPVIMISAIDEFDSVAQCLEAGADDYLTKPIEPVLMHARVRASLDRKRLRDRERERARELEHALEQLQQSNADLNHFAYAVSHDLQEPLRTITSYSQLLERRYQGRLDEDADSFLKFISESGIRMRNFIVDLLTFSKLSTAEQPSLEQEVDATGALQEALANLRTLTAETHAEVEAGPLPAISGNSVEFVQLFQNLISNAIKYRKDGENPRIAVTAERAGTEWVVSVADNGVGIPPQYVQAVFVPFKRLHGREVPGTGIGLALCRRIVERHGGRIWVESPGSGEGSTFRFALPVRH